MSITLHCESCGSETEWSDADGGPQSLDERRVEALELIAMALKEMVRLQHRDRTQGKAVTSPDEKTSPPGWQLPTGESWQIGDHEFDEMEVEK